MKIEVFSYDYNKTFEYQVKTKEFEIFKMNGRITIEILSSESIPFASIMSFNKNMKPSFQPSSLFLKNVNSVLFSGKYKNKKEELVKILSFINDFDDIFENKEYQEIFSIYNTKNNSTLDKIEDSESKEEEESLKLIIKDNNRFLNEKMQPVIEAFLSTYKV